MEKREMQSFK